MKFYEVLREIRLLTEDLLIIWATPTTLIDGGATASYFYGPLKPEQ